jgi:transcriptional regulator with XRE-family HTH domain
MDRRLQLGDLARSKRLANRQSLTSLAYESGVSVATIMKIEKGLPVKDETLGKVLIKLQMLDALKLFRDEQMITGFKSLSIDELRSISISCKDVMRDGDEDEKPEFMFYKNLAEKEIKTKIREIFKEHT